MGAPACSSYRSLDLRREAGPGEVWSRAAMLRRRRTGPQSAVSGHTSDIGGRSRAADVSARYRATGVPVSVCAHAICRFKLETHVHVVGGALLTCIRGELSKKILCECWRCALSVASRHWHCAPVFLAWLLLGVLTHMCTAVQRLQWPWCLPLRI